MAVNDQLITDKYAVYNGDCIEVMQGLPAGCVHLSVYSPPFGGLYHYSSSDRDLSNCDDYDTFFSHYAFVVRELHRITMPGRITAVHCMDVPRSNSGTDSFLDFPGDIIRPHPRRRPWRPLPHALVGCQSGHSTGPERGQTNPPCADMSAAQVRSIRV